jgi:hypothetical protein
MDCACLLLIIETIQSRCDIMEYRLGQSRTARLLVYAIQGCKLIETVFMSWINGVAEEHTHDQDTLAALRILLAIFVTEARALDTMDYVTLQAFRRTWVTRCIKRLERSLVVGDLVFAGMDGCIFQKWGSRVCCVN